MRKGIFDFDGSGEQDLFERAAEKQFIDDVILAEEKKRGGAPDVSCRQSASAGDTERNPDGKFYIDPRDFPWNQDKYPDAANDPHYFEGGFFEKAYDEWDRADDFDPEKASHDEVQPIEPAYHQVQEEMKAETADGKTAGTEETEKPRGITFMGKPFYDARKDSCGVSILRSLTATALIIGGMAVPIATDMGELGMLLCIAAGLGLGMMILKNTD